MIQTRSVTNAINQEKIRGRIAKNKMFCKRNQLLKVEKERLRAALKALFIAEGYHPADFLFDNNTFRGLRQNVGWRAMVLRRCPAKTAAQTVLADVDTFIKKVDDFIKESLAFDKENTTPPPTQSV